MDDNVFENEQDETLENLSREEPVRPLAGRSWLPSALIGALMLLIGLALGYFGRGEFGPEARMAKATASAEAVAAVTRAASSAEMMKYLIDNTRHFKGDENAPVTIIEFSDFQCPFCGVFANDTEGELDKNYVQTGKVRFGYWNYAFLGDESLWSAEAAECAADQDKYWEYHAKLFDSQNGENQGAFTKENLKGFAVDLGLDATEFNDCMDSGEHAELVQSDSALAQQIGVRSTPSFLVNGTPLVGAQPLSAFEEIIELFIK